MDRTVVANNILGIIANNIDRGQLNEEMYFEADLGFGELEMVELTMDLEEYFGLEITDEDAEKIMVNQPIKTAIDYIHKTVTARGE